MKKPGPRKRTELFLGTAPKTGGAVTIPMVSALESYPSFLVSTNAVSPPRL